MQERDQNNKVDVILRHPKERKSKCSLQPLVGRPDLVFYNARVDFQFDASGFILLDVEGEPFNEADKGLPLLLLDSTWRLLPQVQSCVIGQPLLRRLPEWLATCYPRVSKISEDPQGGLASVEAFYAARRLMGRRDDSLLDGYYWREKFLENWME